MSPPRQILTGAVSLDKNTRRYVPLPVATAQLLQQWGNRIQVYLGHRSPQTTALYTHLTHKAEDLAVAAINHVMRDLPW